MPRVAVVFTGGTISMLVDPVSGGNVPTLNGAAILARTPGLDEIAEVVPIDYGLVPASHFRFPQLFDVAGLVRDALADPAVDGAVIVQGTDTIEETAFFYDVAIGGAKPVIVTGAMRSPAEAGYDGPANIRDAVRAASSTALRDAGCVVVIGGRVDPADDVIKMHTSSLTAFRSANGGPLAEVVGSRLVPLRRRLGRRVLDVDRAIEPVGLVTAVVSMDASILDAVVAGGARGVVVEATGSGNTSPELLAGAIRVEWNGIIEWNGMEWNGMEWNGMEWNGMEWNGMEWNGMEWNGMESMERGIPVVLATRCPAGRTSTAYAFPGGGATWARAGALLAGSLSGVKARILLALGLGAGLDRDGLEALFADPTA